MKPHLVMDIGAHDGSDTRYYLSLGYHVVAVEANPKRAQEMYEAFLPYVESGQLVIHAVGIAEQAEVRDFYVNPQNDLLSSFSRAFTERDGTTAHVIPTPTLPARFLFDAYGVPFYLKVDIEGSDRLVLEGLKQATPERPPYLSIEISDPSDIAIVADLGYQRFKLVNQRELPWDGNPSGPFGTDLPGEWMDQEETEVRYALMCATYRLRLPPLEAWFDLHAKYEP